MTPLSPWTRAQLAALRALRHQNELTRITDLVLELARQGYTCMSVEVPTIMVGEELRKVLPDSEIVCRFETDAWGHVRRFVDINWHYQSTQ